MLNFFNPPNRTDDELNTILSNMGSFYSLLDSDSKTMLKNYFNIILVGLEGLYYNVVESTEANNLNSRLPYIDLSYNEITIQESDLAVEKVQSPEIISAITTGTAGTEEYTYGVTAVDSLGNETTISDYTVDATSPNTLSGSDYVKIRWVRSDGAVSYNIYGRTIGNLSKIGSTTNNYFNDTGQALISAVPPKYNNTIYRYSYNLPFDYYIFNLNSFGNYEYDIDFTLDKFKTLKITNLDIINNTNKTFVLKGAYAFLPILIELYLKAFTGSDNYLQPLYDSFTYSATYSPLLDIDFIDGNTAMEKTNKARAYHFTKLFHNLSLLTRRSLNIENLEKILSLIYNTPFSYESGTLSNLQISVSGTTFKIGDYNYKIPYTEHFKFNNGDFVNKYDLLILGVTIEDAYTENSSVSITNSFDENKKININIPTELYIFASDTDNLLISNFFDNILPKNLVATVVNN